MGCGRQGSLPGAGPEAELVARAQSGDEQAFEDLVGATQGRLFSLAVRLLNSRAEAQDVVQEAYIVTYSHLAELDPTRSPMAWLSTVTTRLCLNRLRAGKRFCGVEMETVLESREASSPDVEERLALQQALSRLNAEARALILLHYWGGYSCKEMGEIQERTESAIKVQLFRARERLRQWFER